MGPSPLWDLKLLGSVQLNLQGQAPARLDRRASALLAYLALEGEAPRRRLATLLYPSSGVSAGNNIVHALRRLRQLARGELVVCTPDGRLSLSPLVLVDVHPASDEESESTAESGELLDGLEFSDLPEFEEWLLAWRERLREGRRSAQLAQAVRLDNAGDLAGAAAVVQRLVDLDPLDETLVRQLMALQARSGHRAAAQHAFERLKTNLRRELNVAPQPETAALAHRIARGEESRSPVAHAVRPLPLGVMRPPLLVGREREWAQMAAALHSGRAVALHGQAGVGKSRLLQELVRATPGAALFECRATDAAQPYGSAARLFRDLLRTHPDLRVAPWVRRELSRLLPEWGGAPEPLTSDEALSRFHLAQAEFLRAAMAAGVTLFAWDDTHHLDAATREVLPVIWMELGWGNPDAPFRLAWTTRAVDHAQPDDPLLRPRAVVRVTLQPLDPSSAQSLLHSLNLPALARHAAALERHAGGNPQTLLETVRHVLATDQLSGDGPLNLPPPTGVQALLAERIARLTPQALQVARAAATLQSDFDLELLAEVLATPLMTVAATWEELEAAHLVQGERLSHDLVAETVLSGLGEQMRALLHRSAARALTRRAAPAGRTARHWQAGGDHSQAARAFLAAAGEAQAAYRFREAASWCEEAASLFEAAGNLDAAFDALAQAAEHLHALTLTPRLRAVAARLDGLAQTPRQHALARATWIHPLMEDGDLDGLERLARAGLAAPGDARLEARFHEALAGVCLLRGEMGAARDPLGDLLRVGLSLPDPAIQATAHEGLGLAWAADAPERAAAHYDQAAALHHAGGDRVGEASVLTKRAPLLFALGDAVGALGAAQAAHTQLAGVDGATNLRLINAHERFVAAFSQEEYVQAHAALQDGLSLREARTAGWGGVLQADLALLLTALGEPAGARAALDAALACEVVPENKRHVVLLARVKVLARAGEDSARAAQALMRHSERQAQPLVQLAALLACAEVRAPTEAVTLLDDAVAQAAARGFEGLRRAALARRAAAHLALGRIRAALVDAEQALHLSAAYSLLVSPAEVLLVNAQVLHAAVDVRAPEAWSAYLQHMEETARRVPAHHQESYRRLTVPQPC